ncbi:MAG: type II toxin-antitoxin system RelE/ParE family toxin [Lachnospiraceae bacterium]|nr:type II toxin-antitoxin system RelE/ParE family toxin [Lachnospiraceae bacterium]
MDYNVIVTSDAENELDCYIQYLLYEKRNEQAAANLLDDFEKTVQALSHVAGSLKPCDDPRLKEHGYKRINFRNHRYFMLFRVEGKEAIVDALFHELQDYENRMH